MAAIVGSIKSLRALNMCLVNVALPPPEMKIEMMTSSNEVKNAPVSLTVNDVKKSIFSINLIPHTMKNTTLGLIQTGDIVNIEIDILARYIDQNIRHNINYDNIKLK